MAVTTVAKTIGTTGTFSTPQLWEDGAPANLITSNSWSAGTFVGTFQQGETVTGVGITGGKFLDSDGATYVTFGTTTTPAAGITVTGTTSLATCVLSGSANVGVIWQGKCQNQEFSGTGAQLTISGSTSSSAAYKECTTAAGASFLDNANSQTNALQYNASNGAAIRGTSTSQLTVACIETSARINKLQITATGTGGEGLSASAASVIVDKCIIEGKYAGAGSSSGILRANASSSISNSLVVQRTSSADHIVSTSTSSPKFYNCTFCASDDHATAPIAIFLSGASGAPTTQNCGMFAGDSTKAISAGSATFTHTTGYSDISGTSGVTQATYTSEFKNVNDATRDFRLKAGAAQIDTGTTDSTNAANDIVGTARPEGSAYDVGCWEFTIDFIFEHHYRMQRMA